MSSKYRKHHSKRPASSKKKYDKFMLPKKSASATKRKVSTKRPKIVIKDHLITKDGKEVHLHNSVAYNLKVLEQLTDEKTGTRPRFATRRDVALSIFRRLIAQRTFNQKNPKFQDNCEQWERLAEKYNRLMGYGFNIQRDKCGHRKSSKN